MAESSTDAVIEKVEADDVKPAESSSAEQGGSMLDAVLAAIEPENKEKSPGSAPVSEQADAQSTDTPKGEAADSDIDHLWSDDEKARLHHKTKERIEKLISRAKDAEHYNSTLRPKAEQYDAIASHLQQTGLSSSDLDNTIEIATLIKKGDLFTARDKIMPIVQVILEATGGVLPRDLEEEVKAGTLSAQRAQELAEARSRNVLNTHQNGVRQQMDAQENANRFVRDVMVTVNDWEKVKQRSDPDWGLKAPEIRAGLELAILKGVHPKSVQEAVKMAENELGKVEAKMRQFRPQPKPVRSISGTPQASTAADQPKSLRDAVMQSLDR